jgi:hypothetical protein
MLPGISNQLYIFTLLFYVRPLVSVLASSTLPSDQSTTHDRDLPSPLPSPKIMIHGLYYVFFQKFIKLKHVEVGSIIMTMLFIHLIIPFEVENSFKVEGLEIFIDANRISRARVK